MKHLPPKPPYVRPILKVLSLLLAASSLAIVAGPSLARGHCHAGGPCFVPLPPVAPAGDPTRRLRDVKRL